MLTSGAESRGERAVGGAGRGVEERKRSPAGEGGRAGGGSRARVHLRAGPLRARSPCARAAASPSRAAGEGALAGAAGAWRAARQGKDGRHLGAVGWWPRRAHAQCETGHDSAPAEVQGGPGPEPVRRSRARRPLLGAAREGGRAARRALCESQPAAPRLRPRASGIHAPPARRRCSARAAMVRRLVRAATGLHRRTPPRCRDREPHPNVVTIAGSLARITRDSRPPCFAAVVQRLDAFRRTCIYRYCPPPPPTTSMCPRGSCPGSGTLVEPSSVVRSLTAMPPFTSSSTSLLQVSNPDVRPRAWVTRRSLSCPQLGPSWTTDVITLLRTNNAKV